MVVPKSMDEAGVGAKSWTGVGWRVMTLRTADHDVTSDVTNVCSVGLPRHDVTTDYHPPRPTAGSVIRDVTGGLNRWTECGVGRRVMTSRTADRDGIIKKNDRIFRARSRFSFVSVWFVRFGRARFSFVFRSLGRGSRGSRLGLGLGLIGRIQKYNV